MCVQLQRNWLMTFCWITQISTSAWRNRHRARVMQPVWIPMGVSYASAWKDTLEMELFVKVLPVEISEA